MKKTQKGLTLVEVLVAITVLSITMFALLSTIVAMRKVVARQEEYVKIKMVCQSIYEAYCESGCTKKQDAIARIPEIVKTISFFRKEIIFFMICFS